MIVFDNLWNTLAVRGLTEDDLQKMGVTAEQIGQLHRNQDVSTELVNLLCAKLECRVEDIMQNEVRP